MEHVHQIIRTQLILIELQWQTKGDSQMKRTEHFQDWIATFYSPQYIRYLVISHLTDEV